MAGIVVKKAGRILLIVLKWILQVTLVALKLVFGVAKLFLLLFTLAAGIVLTMMGISVRRR